MADSVTVDHGGVRSRRTRRARPTSARRWRRRRAAPPQPHGDADERAARAAARARREGPLRRRPRRRRRPPRRPPRPSRRPTAPSRPARRRDDTLPRHNPIARMKQALAQKAEAERRAAALEAELAAAAAAGVTSPVTPPAAEWARATPAPGEPQFEQFADAPDPYTAYLQAWTRWDRAQAIAQARAEWEAEQTAEAARAELPDAPRRRAKSQYPDFDQVLTQADTLGLQVSAVMQEAIADSPKAADLVYYLATHPEECTQLAEESHQTPVAAAPVMRRLLESHLAPRAAPTQRVRRSRTGRRQYREAPRHAGRELACRVRRAAGRGGVCGRACALLESALEGPRHPVTPRAVRRGHTLTGVPMANTFITPTWVLKDVARVAVNMLKFAANIERWYDDKYKVGGAKAGYTVSGPPAATLPHHQGPGLPGAAHQRPGRAGHADRPGQHRDRVVDRRRDDGHRGRAAPLHPPGRRAARQHHRLRRPQPA